MLKLGRTLVQKQKTTLMKPQTRLMSRYTWPSARLTHTHRNKRMLRWVQANRQAETRLNLWGKPKHSGRSAMKLNHFYKVIPRLDFKIEFMNCLGVLDTKCFRSSTRESSSKLRIKNLIWKATWTTMKWPEILRTCILTEMMPKSRLFKWRIWNLVSKYRLQRIIADH